MLFCYFELFKVYLSNESFSFFYIKIPKKMTRQTWRIANRLKVSNHPLNFFNCYIDLLNLAYVDAYIRIQVFSFKIAQVEILSMNGEKQNICWRILEWQSRLFKKQTSANYFKLNEKLYYYLLIDYSIKIVASGHCVLNSKYKKLFFINNHLQIWNLFLAN